LYHVLKYLDGNDFLGADDKKHLSRVLRAHLSQDELELLLLDGISPLGREKLWPLVPRYDFLQNISRGNYWVAVIMDAVYKVTEVPAKPAE